MILYEACYVCFNENTWHGVMPEVLWDLLTSDVLVLMHPAPVCRIVVLCAGDLFRNAETLRFSFPVRAVGSKNPVVCIGEDLLGHWF